MTSEPIGAIRTIGAGSFQGAIFSPDEMLLYATHAGTVTSFDVRSGFPVKSLLVSQELGGMDISPDGSSLIFTERELTGTITSNGVTTTDYLLYVVNTSTWLVNGFNLGQTDPSHGAFYDVARLPDGEFLLTESGSVPLPLITLDPNTAVFTPTSHMYDTSGVLAATADHSYIVFAPQGGSDSSLFLYLAGSGIIASHVGGGGPGNGVLAISPDGELIAQGGAELTIYDDNLRPVADLSSIHPELGGGIVGMAFSHDDHLLYLLDSDTNSIIEVETSHWTIAGQILLYNDVRPAVGYGDTLQLSADDHYLSVAGPTGLELVDLTIAISNGASDDGNSIIGTAARDVLDGFGGADRIEGGAGNDLLRGGAGDDWLSGGAGRDTIVGGSGADTIEGDPQGLNGDTITDFAAGDRIRLDGVTRSSFTYEHTGDLLKLGTAEVEIGSGPIRLIVSAGSDATTVDLIAANRMSGITDFDGDGHSDILWRNADGRVSTWSVTGNAAGNQIHASVFNGAAATNWQIVETGDFNGDAASDIIWRDASGQVAIWHGDGNGGSSADYLHGSVGTQWKIAGTGDLNGDGKDDLLWRNDDGSISTWTSNGSGFAENSYYHGSVGTSWKVEGLADFDGDGKADILWRNDNGAISTWTSTGSSFGENSYFDSSVGTDWHIAGLADFDGDGKADILWRNANGAISIWTSNGSGFTQAAYSDNSVGNAWHIAMAGDFNDDGKADILWRNDNGAVSTWESNSHGFNESVANGWAPGDWSIASHTIPL